jgi:hypothetical protein
MRWATFERRMQRVEASEAICNAHLFRVAAHLFRVEYI